MREVRTDFMSGWPFPVFKCTVCLAQSFSEKNLTHTAECDTAESNALAARHIDDAWEENR